jgi:predicted PurR-regulated permease PerM
MIQALKNNWRLVVFLAAAFIFLVLAWAWRGVLLPFVIGLILAYLMLPGVNWLEKKLPPKNKCQKARRIAAILIVFVITIGIVGGILSYVIITVIQTLSIFFPEPPNIYLLLWIKSSSGLTVFNNNCHPAYRHR